MECSDGEKSSNNQICHDRHAQPSSSCEELEVSTKIPPWELTSISYIRQRAAASRQTLLGFCKDGKKFLDVYYIHAPRCWDGWHTRCHGIDNERDLIPLRDAWLAMECVVGIDGNARRIGLSNVHPQELLDIISFVKERQHDTTDNEYDNYPPPRMPDVLQAYADPLYPNQELRDICQMYGIEFVSYSTLGTQHRGVSNPVLGNEQIRQISQHHERSAAEVVLSWAIQRNMSVIPRSSKQHHIRELANLLTSPTFLHESDLIQIDQLSYN